MRNLAIDRELILLRHAKSSWGQADLADHDRPLNGRGRRQAPLVGAWLAAEDCEPDLVLCSSARRARETLEGLLGAGGWQPPVVFEEGLYHAEPEAVLELIAWLGGTAHRLLVVGHNPGLSDLSSRLAGREIALRTACLTRFELSAPWSDLVAAGPGSARFIDLACPGHAAESDA